MPTQSIPIGPPTTLVTNQIYALPAVNCTLFTDAATPTLEQSTVIGFGTKVALTFTNGACLVSGGFVRATAGTPTIVLKRN